MQVACWITKARIQTHTHIKHLLLHNLLIPSDLVKCFTATLAKTETVQWFICHYDLFGQTVRLKKAMSK
jgi:hypothetical protein